MGKTGWIIIALIITASLSVSAADEVKIKTSAVCNMCKSKIEKSLSEIKGVQSATLDVASGIVAVKYDANKTNPAQLRQTIALVGYDADDVKADKKACENLPACCKRKGGGAGKACH